MSLQTLEFDTYITGTVRDFGDEDVFTFNGSSGQRVYYDGILNLGSGSNSVSTRLFASDDGSRFSIPAGSNSEVITLL